ncbi:hypothetical protein [Methylomicrobium album]|jgi:hypothetical protein|uniref:HTH merR-type domain-containing protein n=1 Tax=Methylomicrobium album BG8 TaxID=686340 RepID=H8GR40_METAL|nr:hypothetical protein [Methylomicrobium album]EIC29867.1 hypothetical protein Metal_2112 [Methylomicrobium album BG8]
MIDSTKLRPSQVAVLIYAWLKRHRYDIDFKNDIAMLLAENRRIGRRSNVLKYGRIPYTKGLDGKAYYDWADIKMLIKDRLEPICKELERQRLEKAAKAAKGARLPYAT